jgi:hypothetical protein
MASPCSLDEVPEGAPHLVTQYLHAMSLACGIIGSVVWMPMTTTLSPVFVKQLKQAGKMIRFSIRPAQGGWELVEEADSQILRQVRVSDWHRVERARDIFSLKALSLQDNGWVEV